jgi:regulator of protease activity HflC (stomatin/prohibitin superfamily)
MENSSITKIVKRVVIGLIVLIVLFGSFGTVATGKIGVKSTLNKVVGTVQPGMYFKLPIFQKVVTMDVQVQKEQADATAASKDLQTVNAKIAINYKLDEAKVMDLYSRIGTDYKARVIDPAIQEVVKAATAGYTAEELITKRPEVTDKIQLALSQKLAESDILVSSNGVSIINFDFSSSFNKAIEEKVTAEQNALAAKNKLSQVEFEAQQTIATAKATAEAQRISSAALAAQGGSDYVQLKAIEKWNGILPVQMIPGSTVPFVNLKN